MPSKSFLKVAGLILLLSLGPLSIYLLYKQTGGLESRKELAFHRNVRFAFMAGTDHVALKPLTDFPWETVCAFGPGLSQDDVNALVGFDYSNFSQLTWRNLEDHWTLLFIDAERETNWGLHRPVVPIRVPKEDIAGYSETAVDALSCAGEDAVLMVSRLENVELGKTPVSVRLAGQSSEVSRLR